MSFENEGFRDLVLSKRRLRVSETLSSNKKLCQAIIDAAGNPIRGGRLIDDGEAEVVRRILREYA